MRTVGFLLIFWFSSRDCTRVKIYTEEENNDSNNILGLYHISRVYNIIAVCARCTRGETAAVAHP